MPMRYFPVVAVCHGLVAVGHAFFLLRMVSPVVQFLYANNPPLARLLCLVLDIVLDFESSVAIPIFLILPYRADYDFVDDGFDFMDWYSDFWLINTIIEFKLLFVNSWGDLVARVFLSVCLLIALQSVKSLLRKRTQRVNPRSNVVTNSSGSARPRLRHSCATESTSESNPLQSHEPDNLHLKWPTSTGSINCFEQGMLEIVPPVIERMKPGFLSLVSNGITEVPSHIFTNEEAVTIWLSGNPIEKLPEALVPSASIRMARLANTALKALSTWMDDRLFAQTHLIACGSPFCDDLLAVMNASSNGGGSGANRSMDVGAAALTAFTAGSLDCKPTAGDHMTYCPSVEEANFDHLWRNR